MNYPEIKTEKIKENLWIAKTIYLNCEVSIEGRSEVEAKKKLILILEEE